VGQSMLRARLSSMQFTDGTNISIPSEGMVLLVGPNNVGKTQALWDTSNMARTPGLRGTTVVNAEFELDNENDLAEWAEQALSSIVIDRRVHYHISSGERVDIDQLQARLSRDGTLRSLADRLVLYADGNTRLTAGSSIQTINFETDPAVQPLRRLYQDPKLEREIDAGSRDAFRTGVAVDGSTNLSGVGPVHAADFCGRVTAMWLRIRRW
jgi:hypothetical protein